MRTLVGGYAEEMNGRRRPAKTPTVTDRSRFVQATPVTALGATQMRIAFVRWLHRHFSLAADRLGAVALAVNEALANAAEFGYRGIPGRGIVALTACYDDATDTLAVTVTDEGRWRPTMATTPTTATPYGVRGRGMLLMQALSEEMRIDVSERGTQICLSWAHLTTPERPASENPRR